MLVLRKKPLDSRTQGRVALAGLVQVHGAVLRVSPVQRFGKEGLFIHVRAPFKPCASPQRISAMANEAVRTECEIFLRLLTGAPVAQTGSKPRLSRSHARA